MKKLLAISLVALIVGSASAVTMNWAATGISFDGSKLASNENVTGYLLAVASYSDSYSLTSDFEAKEVGAVLGSVTGTTRASKITDDWTIDTNTYGNGDTFAVLLKYVNGSDTYWNLAKELVQMEGMTLDPPVNANDTSSAFNYGMGTDGILTAGGGWAKATSTEPVIPDTPEPATGALALAGVALLFRRRRA